MSIDSIHKKLPRFMKYIVFTIVMTMFIACVEEQILPATDTTQWPEVKVAVVAPLSQSNKNAYRYERISKLFTENILKAQQGDTTGLRLEIEWYDDGADMYALSETLSDREDLSAVICMSADDVVEIMAEVLDKSGLPLIVATTSEELVRRYSSGTAGVKYKEPFMWSVCETDVTMSYSLLMYLSMQDTKKISLISPLNDYGDTFDRWIPFYCIETDINLVKRCRYNNVEDMSGQIDAVLNSDVEYVICAVNNFDEAKLLIDKYSKKSAAPKLIFTSGVISENLPSLYGKAEGVEGFAPYMSPYSGFEVAYKELYHEQPMTFEGQFYDALMLSYVGATYCHYCDGNVKMNEALKLLSNQPVENKDFNTCGTPVWDYFNMGKKVLDKVKQGQLPEYAMVGACNTLKFVDNGYTSLNQSFFVHWVIYYNNFVVLNHISTIMGRTMNYVYIWQLEIMMKEEIKNEDVNISYEPLKEQWAVLVCGSEGWNNYRHQADVLNVYQMLKKEGIDDSRIILIMRDDIAYHEKNLYQGRISVTPDGENLYEDVEIDYRADTITVKDIQDILEGNASERLHIVLEGNTTSNVFFYWSGHGDVGYFRWLETSEKFTNEMMRSTLEKMNANGKYRKMLICAEPCHAASVVKEANGIPGILAMSSADENESSYADFYNNELNVWMCDRFTYTLVSLYKEDKYLRYTFNDYYNLILKSTIGSHLKVFNAQNFDNLFMSYPCEFFNPICIY